MKRVLLAAVACALGSASCNSSDAPRVTAKQITSRTDLIGGPGALGDIGDYLLSNEKIRLIVQGPGYSRGFGIYGGSLIDADLQRPQEIGSSAGGRGYDHFSELFPAIFLKAMKPGDNGISVVDNADGSASVVVTGTGDEFVFIAKRIDDLLIDTSTLLFKNEYRLYPGKRYVEIITTVINQGDQEVELPGQGILSLSQKLKGFQLPVGDVILFGAGNDVFSPFAGFDLRFTLQTLYDQAVALPKLPGLVTPFLATRGDHVSYGFASGITDPERSFVSRTGYANARVDDLVVPFIASSFTGSFYGAAPGSLGPRASRDNSFSFKKYFIVGSGDIASVRDVFHEIRGQHNIDMAKQSGTVAEPTSGGTYSVPGLALGLFSGVVRDKLTQAPQPGVSVITFDASGSPYSQHTTDALGTFKGTYEVGHYTYRVVSDGRFTTDPVAFDIAADEATYFDVFLPPPGYVSVRTRSEDGRLMPARCELVGVYPESAAGFDAKTFLYNFKWGEPQLPTDRIPDTLDPATRQYIAHSVIATSGEQTDPVRPGSYHAVCSRGIEYDTYETDVQVNPGELTMIDGVLHHVVDTRGWASGDYHMHSVNSVDSGLKLELRIGHAAAEGLDIACSTDHNFVTDYTPYIMKQGLETWIQGMVGLEMTTLEIGHFNGFPLVYNPGPITKGAFAWSGFKPDTIFDNLRGLGKYGKEATIVQVNHPRDTILGYFNDYHMNPDTGLPEDSTSLLMPIGPEFGPDKYTYNFDAIEIFNGKRFDLLHTYRVPDVLPPPPIPANIPPAGTVLRDKNGKIAFPGSLEDWYTLLNLGYLYTATGNSDSHSTLDEPAYPRTYTPVSNDQPGEIIEPEVIGALKNQQALVTNGPFIRATLTGAGCYDHKQMKQPHADCQLGEVTTAMNGGVTLKVSVDAPPWMTISHVNIIVGGKQLTSIPVDNTTMLAIPPQTIAASKDTWVVIEASGDKTMWPVLTPLEIPPIQISDALNDIGGAFGINFNPYGNLQPARVFPVYPYGFTNPIYIDADGDNAFTAPGVAQQALTAQSAPRLDIDATDANEMPALVKLFSAFAAHAQ
jgi:hypothetical protein